MPPDAMRSRISYCPKRSGLDEGGSGGRGSDFGAGALGVVAGVEGGGVPGLEDGRGVRVAAGEGGAAAAGRAGGGKGVLPDGVRGLPGTASPESVSESIRSMSASAENFLPAAAFSGEAGPDPVRTVSREASMPDNVSRSL